VPELPDISAYIIALTPRICGSTLERVSIRSPFLLRTAAPPLECANGRRILSVRRIGKRIAIEIEGDLWLVIHLMIAGRLHWKPRDGFDAHRGALAIFQFSTGTLTLTEAGSKRRASVHLVQGEHHLAEMDAGGIDVFAVDEQAFRTALTRENHTLKRALTDPHAISGIGNAYSDEILHAARLSPVALTSRLSAEEWTRLFQATKTVLQEWMDRLSAAAANEFPEKVTAFRSGMAVHGRYGKPCPVCGETVRRIRYADNETNYCPHCQTAGRILADRALSRLLR
jgi:formamidopyrimidine-DNA glycosylase